MKNAFVLLYLLIVLVLSAFNTREQNTRRDSQYSDTYKVISENDFKALTKAYQTKYPNETLGGKIGKKELEDMLIHIRSTEPDMHFRFGIDAKFNQTTLMFMAEKLLNSDFIRNGNMQEAFCSEGLCETGNRSDITLNISHKEYLYLSNLFQSTKPNSIYGGNIDKSALSVVVNSLPETDNVVQFRFCEDPDYNNNLSVIFIGGGGLFIRNTNVAAFCPTQCRD